MPIGPTIERVNGLQPESERPCPGRSPLASDTLPDKSVRFVCGASIGFRLVLGVAEVGEVLTLEGLILVGGLIVAACDPRRDSRGALLRPPSPGVVVGKLSAIIRAFPLMKCTSANQSRVIRRIGGTVCRHYT